MRSIRPSKKEKINNLALSGKIFRSTLLEGHPDLKENMKTWQTAAIEQKAILLPLEYDFIMGMANRWLDGNEQPWQGEDNQVGKILQQIKSRTVQGLRDMQPLPQLKEVPIKWMQSFFLEQFLTGMLDNISLATTSYTYVDVLQELADYEYLPSCLKNPRRLTGNSGEFSILNHFLLKLNEAYKYTKHLDDDYGTARQENLCRSDLGLLRLRLIEVQLFIVNATTDSLRDPVPKSVLESLLLCIHTIINEFNSPHLQKTSVETRSKLLVITAKLFLQINPLNQYQSMGLGPNDCDILMYLLWKHDIKHYEIVSDLFSSDRKLKDMTSKYGQSFDFRPIVNLISLCEKRDPSLEYRLFEDYIFRASSIPIEIAKKNFAFFKQQFPQFTVALQESLKRINELDNYYHRLPNDGRQKEYQVRYTYIKQLLSELAEKEPNQTMENTVAKEGLLASTEIKSEIPTTTSIPKTTTMASNNQALGQNGGRLNGPQTPSTSTGLPETRVHPLSIFSGQTTLLPPPIRSNPHAPLNFDNYLSNLGQDIAAYTSPSFLEASNQNLLLNAQIIFKGFETFLGYGFGANQIISNYNKHNIIFQLTGLSNKDIVSTIAALPRPLKTVSIERTLRIIMGFIYANLYYKLRYSKYPVDIFTHPFQNLIFIFEGKDRYAPPYFKFIRHDGILTDKPFQDMVNTIETIYQSEANRVQQDKTFGNPPVHEAKNTGVQSERATTTAPVTPNLVIPVQQPTLAPYLNQTVFARHLFYALPPPTVYPHTLPQLPIIPGYCPTIATTNFFALNNRQAVIVHTTPNVVYYLDGCPP